MAIPTNIKTLLAGNVVEWARIEFKETWDSEASLKTICAFANDIDNWGGGYIVIGVREEQDNSKLLVGIAPSKIDSILKDMFNKCKCIRPEYMPITEVAEYQGKKFIVIWAPGGSVRPYSSPKHMGRDCKEFIYYIRKMASTVAPTEEEKRDLYALANNVPFDDRINHEADITDLNVTLIQSYLKEVSSSLYAEIDKMEFIDLCKNMNIVNSLPEYTKPKNVGLMFFSLNPQKYFPYAQIDIVQFPEGLGGDKIIENTFTGPLHQQLRSALQYIQSAIIQEKVIKYPDRAEADRFYNYPFAAIEEALSNAVYHKGYDVREPIEVRVLPDRIEIVSHPGADRSITKEGLRRYRVFNRRYRNRRIGEFLKEMHLTEGRNTGFRKILNALEANGSPKPLFETDDERLSFASTIFIHSAFLESDETENETENNALNGVEKVVWQYFKRYPRNTILQLCEELNLSRSHVTRAIRALKGQDLLERQGSDRKGEWIVKAKALGD
ncbi:MAG: ATP-binding protein [Phascolarctobacterium sp.]|uniref:ATP-binding protein n=1 Tax=Phascolarctobacterium sp. TaxID=2049039 RepID=UPI0026DCAE61|nr:ATP-binding protein [Phascolarctobacterium sp.]MDO4920615.1 ATP-binding protein [Phascolarctobacterium sp.]